MYKKTKKKKNYQVQYFSFRLTVNIRILNSDIIFICYTRDDFSCKSEFSAYLHSSKNENMKYCNSAEIN